jgi:hypothetical protein
MGAAILADEIARHGMTWKAVGKISDCGGEVLFSAYRENLAFLYARKKMETEPHCGRILFDREGLERSPGTSLTPCVQKSGP